MYVSAKRTKKLYFSHRQANFQNNFGIDVRVHNPNTLWEPKNGVFKNGHKFSFLRLFIHPKWAS